MLTKILPPEDPEFGIIVMCAVRYAMGRRTYMPQLVIDFCKRNWGFIKNGDRLIIMRDVYFEIEHELENPGWLGDKCDSEAWQDFYKWMRENENLCDG